MKDLYFITILLFSIYVSHGQIINIPDANFKNALVNSNCVDTNGDGIYDSNVDVNNDGQIQESEVEAILRLNVSNKDISSLEGIQSFINLEKLICTGNNLISLNVSLNTNLQWLQVRYNELTNLDLNQNINLRRLYIKGNNLTSLDVSSNTNLEWLECSLNQLNSLDVSNNSNLIRLEYDWNYLTNLDLSQNTNLEWLNCSANNITNLDISQNINLEWFSCATNNLNNLDVSHNGNLQTLSFYDNQISSINLSQNPNLKYLYCRENLLTSLDLSQNSNLVWLHADQNQLNSLNIKNGNNENMARMWAQDNPNLMCIQVDDVEFSNNAIDWRKDTTSVYSEYCELDIQDYKQSTAKIYPNPVKEILRIDSQEPIDDLKIFSMSGRLVKGAKENHINVSLLPSGIYFASVIIDGENRVIRFIKD